MASDMAKEKEKITQKVVKQNSKFVKKAVDIVINYFEEKNGETDEICSNDKVCPHMIASECDGLPFVDESLIRQILDVMYREEYLERDIPEGTGTPHYSMS